MENYPIAPLFVSNFPERIHIKVKFTNSPLEKGHLLLGRPDDKSSNLNLGLKRKRDNV